MLHTQNVLLMVAMKVSLSQITDTIGPNNLSFIRIVLVIEELCVLIITLIILYSTIIWPCKASFIQSQKYSLSVECPADERLLRR